MTLAEKRQTFTANLAKLIDWATTEPDHAVALDQVKRTPAEAAANAAAGSGIKNSLHLLGLAADLLLYVNGQYRYASEDYYDLGQYWKSLHPDNCWGGDFSRPDGNHFSMQYEGVK